VRVVLGCASSSKISTLVDEPISAARSAALLLVPVRAFPARPARDRVFSVAHASRTPAVAALGARVGRPPCKFPIACPGRDRGAAGSGCRNAGHRREWPPRGPAL